MKKIILSCVVFLVALTALFAVPYTTMGLLRTPDAYVLPNKAAEFTFTNYFRRFTQDPQHDTFEYVPMGMVNVGLFNRVELGGWYGDEVGFANVKVKVIEETLAIPQVAVGVNNLLSPIREDANKIKPGQAHDDGPDNVFYEKNSPYVAFSKSTVVKGMPGIPSLETILSFGFGRNAFRGQISLSHKFEGLFGSVAVKPLNNLTLIGEMDGFNINFGAQYFYRNFTLKASMVSLEESDRGRSRIGLGVGYLFDKYADARQRPSLFMDESNLNPKATSETVLQAQKEAASSNNDLLEELRKLREQREQAQKVLEDLRNQLKDMEEEANTEQ